MFNRGSSGLHPGMVLMLRLAVRSATTGWIRPSDVGGTMQIKLKEGAHKEIMVFLVNDDGRETRIRGNRTFNICTPNTAKRCKYRILYGGNPEMIEGTVTGRITRSPNGIFWYEKKPDIKFDVDNGPEEFKRQYMNTFDFSEAERRVAAKLNCKCDRCRNFNDKRRKRGSRWL